jgi:Short-chain dehydrogenases of various substrate specificities
MSIEKTETRAALPPHPLRGAVVVITGASSGIGRATARAFAGHGARLVLTARNGDGLRETAGECAMHGAHSLVVPADVTDAEQMKELARKAVEAFGRIDVWINNAGVGLFGPVLKADMAAQRRVVEIDLLGAMNGAAAVLPQFVRQGRGILISNISVGGFVPVPFAAAYTAAKFGLRGYMAALRQELVAHPRIHVGAVFPAVIDTPGFQHGANVSGVELRPAGPIFPPEKVADAMVEMALRPRAERPVGWPSHLAKWGFGVAPRITEWVAGAVLRRYVRKARRMPEAREGNLFEQSRGRITARGGWRRERRGGGKRGWIWAGLAGAGVVLAVAGVGVARRGRR